MNDKQSEKISDELVAIKKLLILLLQEKDIKGETIAKALGISGGRLSQIVPTRKNKKKREEVKNG